MTTNPSTIEFLSDDGKTVDLQACMDYDLLRRSAQSKRDLAAAMQAAAEAAQRDGTHPEARIVMRLSAVECRVQAEEVERKMLQFRMDHPHAYNLACDRLEK